MSLSPGELAQGNYCLYEVSKNLTGQLTLAHAHQPVCSSPSCNPLVHEQFLLLDVAFNKDCDSQLLKTALDGVLLVRYFVTVFTGPRETLRGVHAGQYDWTPAAGGRITGTLEGISNAGVLRPTIFRPDCERCDEAGIVSGHLFGTGNGVPGVPMPDFQLDAVYRLAWDPLAWDFANPHPLTAPVRGTLEGVLIVTCQ